jgi:hypothetical protein
MASFYLATLFWRSFCPLRPAKPEEEHLTSNSAEMAWHKDQPEY